MAAEPFTLADAARVLRHPETPASYVDWVELLPLTGIADREHLGNSLAWSHAAARRPIGASRRTFDEALRVGADLLDEWMASLAATPIEDFLDHHVPFLRNVTALSDREGGVRSLLDAYRRPAAPEEQPAAARKLARPAPESVILEITRSCNFACTMCSSRTGGFLPDRTMPLPVFGEYVRVLGPRAKTIRVNGYGETTLVPALDRYLDCLDEFEFGGIREIITNLSAPAEVYVDLLARGFVILASWDATRPDLFESIRAGSGYADLIGTLRATGAAARGQPERLGLLITVQERNLAEVPRVVELAEEVGAGLVIFNMVKEADGSPWMDARFEEVAALFDEGSKIATDRGVTVRAPDHVGRRRLRVPGVRRSSATFCDRPWSELLVRWDGEATVCNMCNPWSYGSLRPPGPDQDLAARFERLWAGPNAAVFRALINTATPHPYCADCYFLHA